MKFRKNMKYLKQIIKNLIVCTQLRYNSPCINESNLDTCCITKGLQKACGPWPALGPAWPDGLKLGPSPARAHLWAGRAAGLILGPARRPAHLKKNYKNKKY